MMALAVIPAGCVRQPAGSGEPPRATAFAGAMAAAESEDGFVVVLDPGHGGKDYGAIGRVTNEKTINLDVALRVRRLLDKYSGLKRHRLPGHIPR